MEQKINWMLLLAFGILSSLFFSCRKIIDHRQEVRYIYVNNSGYPVLINTYRKVFQDKTYSKIYKDKYLISKKDSLVQETELGMGSVGDLISYADSVEVVFDKKKVSRYSVNDSPNSRSLLPLKNYERNKKNEVRVYRYVFSNTDYQNAEDCNGNCN